MNWGVHARQRGYRDYETATTKLGARIHFSSEKEETKIKKDWGVHARQREWDHETATTKLGALIHFSSEKGGYKKCRRNFKARIVY